MADKTSLLDRVCELLYRRSDGTWSTASGFFLAGNRVLSASHVTDWKHGSRENLLVRLTNGDEYTARTILTGNQTAGFDLAVLEVDIEYEFEPLPAATLSRADPTPLTGCWAVGYPRYQEEPRAQPNTLTGNLTPKIYRQSAQVWGFVLPGSRLRGEPSIELQVTAEPLIAPEGHSAWAGMSGAVVFFGFRSPVAIGVIRSHSTSTGASTLTITPFDQIREQPNRDAWLAALGSLSDLQSVDATAAHPASSTELRSVVAYSALRTASLLLAYQPGSQMTTSIGEPENQWQNGQSELFADVASNLAMEIAGQACELIAAPQSGESTEVLRHLTKTRQFTTIVDQMLSRRMTGLYTPEAADGFKRALGRLGATHGLTSELSEKLFESLERLSVCGEPTSSLRDDQLVGTWQQAFIYSLDTLNNRLANLSGDNSYSADELDAFLARLRQRVHESSSRISLTSLGHRRSYPVPALYVEPQLKLLSMGIHGISGRAAPTTASAIDLLQAIQAMHSAERLHQWARPRDVQGANFQRGNPRINGSRVVVLGQPGIGKSTLARKLAFDHSEEDSKHAVTIIVVLRDLMSNREHRPSILSYIADLCRSGLQLSDADTGLVNYLLLGGDLNVIFDGLDEVIDPEGYAWITQAISSFCLEYKAAGVTVTCRDQGFDPGLFQSFAIVALQPFSNEQVRIYAEQWFALDDELGDDQRRAAVSDLIEQTEATHDLRSIPLLLTLMCVIFASEGSIPSSRSEVYQRCANLYFRDWDAWRRIAATELISKLPASILFDAFSFLASQIFGDSELSGKGISASQIRGSLVRFFAERELFSAGEERDTAKAMADFITGRAWLMDKVGRNEYGQTLFQFTHRTFLEYFVAEHHVRTAQSAQSLALFLICATRKRGQRLVGELAIQNLARDRPIELAPTVAELIRLAEFLGLPSQIGVAHCLISVVGAVPIERRSIAVAITFVVQVIGKLTQVGLDTWTLNGYFQYEDSGWFDYRSLHEIANEYSADAVGELIGRLVRIDPISPTLLTDVVSDCLIDLVEEDARAGGYVLCALTATHRFGVGGRSTVRSSPVYKRWSSVQKDIWRRCTAKLDPVLCQDPSLATAATWTLLQSGRRFLRTHGLAALFRPWLNPCCESWLSLGGILINDLAWSRQTDDGPVPTPGDREFLLDIFEFSRENPGAHQQFAKFPSSDWDGIARYSDVSATTSPDVTLQEEAGGIILCILADVLFSGGLADSHLGPHLDKYRDFLTNWRSFSADHSSLQARVGDREVAQVILQQATWMRAFESSSDVPSLALTHGRPSGAGLKYNGLGKTAQLRRLEEAGEFDRAFDLVKESIAVLRQLTLCSPAEFRLDLLTGIEELLRYTVLDETTSSGIAKDLTDLLRAYSDSGTDDAPVSAQSAPWATTASSDSSALKRTLDGWANLTLRPNAPYGTAYFMGETLKEVAGEAAMLPKSDAFGAALYGITSVYLNHGAVNDALSFIHWGVGLTSRTWRQTGGNDLTRISALAALACATQAGGDDVRSWEMARQASETFERSRTANADLRWFDILAYADALSVLVRQFVRVNDLESATRATHERVWAYREIRTRDGIVWFLSQEEAARLEEQKLRSSRGFGSQY